MNIKNILITISLLAGSQAMFAAEAPIPYPTQSATLSDMPTDLKLIITNLLTNFKKYDDAIKAINALYQTDKKFRTIVETTNPEWLINTLAQNYACASKEEIAKDLKIASIRKLLQSKENNWLKTAIAEEAAARNEVYNTPLYRAISSDNLETVKKLVAEGADFKKIAGEAIANRAGGMSPTNERTLQIVQFFLEKGIDPECLGLALINYASTASKMKTKKEKDLEIIQLLIKNGVNVNYKKGANTALLWAAITATGGNTSEATLAIVTYLLEHGAKPNIKDRQGKTALDWAGYNSLHNLIPVLNKYGAEHGSEFP